MGIAIVVDGKLAYAGGVGAQSRGGPPVDGDSLFLLASATKMLTAVTVLSLVQDGKLDLRMPVVTYLANLSVESPFDVHAMTLSRLLSHTDGLEDTTVDSQCSLARFSDYGASGPVTLWGTPGTYWDYSNDDYALAAQAIESVVGAGGYEQAVHDRVFASANMATATFDAVAATSSANATTGYLADPTGAFTRAMTLAQTAAGCPVTEPAGFAIVSAEDMGNFIVTMLAGGGTMLTPSSVAQMETGQMATGAHPEYGETYGYGLFIDQVGGETVIEHQGDFAPFHSEVGFIPGARFGVAMLINTDAPIVFAALKKAALDIFAPPPSTPASPIKTSPSSWTDYVGTYVDSYGTLGTFSVDVQDGSLLAHSPDGGTIGSLIQVDDDEWALPNSPYEGVFWRDDAGAVIEIVTRLGVPVRVGTEGG